jgi:hypothetical protein
VEKLKKLLLSNKYCEGLCGNLRKIDPGANDMMSIFGDFARLERKMAFFLKLSCDPIFVLYQVAVFTVKSHFFSKVFDENIFQTITLVHDYCT